LDEAGYIPISYILNFPDILAIGADYNDIIEQLSKLPQFELDLENETMRRVDWKKVFRIYLDTYMYII
jgi:hypothetical protein